MPASDKQTHSILEQENSINPVIYFAHEKHNQNSFQTDSLFCL